MLLAGTKKLKKDKKKKKKKKNVVKTRGDLAIIADITQRLKSVDPLQVQVWIPNLKNLRQLVLQVTAADGMWTGIPWRIHAKYPELYTIDSPSFKLDPAWKIFHPNISLEDNTLCLGFTREWKPEYHLAFQCQMILSILSHLNERDPLNQSAGRMVIADKEEGTSKFAALVARTLKGGVVNVSNEGEDTREVLFPSMVEMIKLAQKVPEEWTDARAASQHT